MFPLDTRIIVADDMEAIRNLLVSHLENLGFKNIQVAADGSKTIDLLTKGVNTQQPIGLILCDWNMPVKTGMDVLLFVRSHQFYAKLPFIMVTQESEREQIAQAVLQGVSHYIMKPFTAATVKERLESVFQRISG